MKSLRRMTTIWRPLSATALVVSLGGAALTAPTASAQDALPPITDAAPLNTAFFQQVDLDFAGAQWQQSDQLMERLGFPDALETWQDELLSHHGNMGSFTEADFDAVTGGEAALVVSDDAIATLMHVQSQMMAEMSGTPVASPVSLTEGEPLGVAMILRASDADAAWDYAQSQTNAFADKNDLEVVSTPYGSGEIVETTGGEGESTDDLDSPYDALLGAHGDKEFAAGRAGDYIIGAATAADVEQIIDVIDGNAPSLSESEPLTQIAAELPAPALAFTYVDAEAIVGALDADTVATIEAMQPGLSLADMGSYSGLTLTAVDEGFRMDSYSIASDNADPSKVIVPNSAETTGAAAHVPADTFIYSAGTLPPGSFAGGAYSLAQAVNAMESGEEPQQTMPSAEEVDAAIAQATETLGFNPATDLFDILGPDYLFFSSFPSFMDEFSFNAVAAVSTSDPTTLAGTMEKLSQLITRVGGEDVSLTTRDMAGDTVYSIGDPNDENSPTVDFGVVGNQAVAGIGTGLDQLSATPADALADDPQYQEIMGTLPAEYSSVFYVDARPVTQLAMMFSGGFSEGGAEATPMAEPAGSLENLLGFGAVASSDSDTSMAGSAILYIAEPGS
ncbi:MAG: DUF3352 domain-containing protein [Thermomicrobiales bacterium]